MHPCPPVCLVEVGEEVMDLSVLESVAAGEWKRPHWCHPEQGCLRIEVVRVVVPKNWERLSRRQKFAMQTVIDALLLVGDAPTLREEQECSVHLVDPVRLQG